MLGSKKLFIKSYIIWNNEVLVLIPYGREFNQDLIRGWIPIKDGYIYTIPHLETVAGEATNKSYTSNIIVIWGVKVKIWPEFKQSFLLSSKTVFIDSIHKLSTGPSKTIQCL